MLYPNEIVINDMNAHQWVNPTVDGEVKKCGTIPRDYVQAPFGTYPGEREYKAVEMPVIPRSEWSERIREKIANKTQLSDIRNIGKAGGMIPSTDQDGRGYAISNDSEVLVEGKGWVLWPEYNWTDKIATVNQRTHLMEFQVPTHRYVAEYDDEMFYSTNRRLDFGVTRQHRLFVRKWDESKRTLSDRYSFVQADKLGWYAGFMPAPKGFIGTTFKRLKIEDDREYDGNDLLALTSLLVSDGYASTDGSLVSFCCFREDRHDQVDALARRCGFKEQASRRGVWKRYAPALSAWVRANCYVSGELRSPNKCIPQLVKVASMQQIKHFLEWFGDQNHGEDASTTFYSSSKRLIDDLQELHLMIGKRATISKREGRSTVYTTTGQTITGGPSYVLHVAKAERLCIDRKKHIETDRYKGVVQCPTMPNGTVISRRNGSVLISGNCWNHSPISAMLLIRARDNMPFVDLSAYAGACKIKNFADQGGWGAQGLDFAMKYGCPSSKFWPQRSTARANDNPQTWENALLHRFTEGWIDLTQAQYDRNLAFDQEGTCLLNNDPVIKDENWWGHSICGMDLVDGVSQWKITRAESGKLMSLQEFNKFWGVDEVTAGYGVRIWNSWGDNWGANGTGVLTGQKAISDGATSPRVTTPSTE